MSEESVTIVEQPSFEDPVAARGEAVLRMCLAAGQIKNKDARLTLLRAAERVISSIPVAQGVGASVSPVPGGRRL